jgi:hypothetical protein
MRSLLAVGMMLVWVAGCAFGPRNAPIPYENPFPLPPMDRDYAWEQIVDVLDDYFEIEREERGRAVGDVVTVGRIDTFPAVGSTILEPWRGDSVTTYDRIESTLQSIRRRAVVQVIPAEGGTMLVEVQVFKELEHLPQPEMAPTASATFRYDNSLLRFTEPIGGQPVPMGWIAQGRDPGLEQKILCKLISRLNPPPPWWRRCFN